MIPGTENCSARLIMVKPEIEEGSILTINDSPAKAQQRDILTQ